MSQQKPPSHKDQRVHSRQDLRTKKKVCLHNGLLEAKFSNAPVCIASFFNISPNYVAFDQESRCCTKRVSSWCNSSKLKHWSVACRDTALKRMRGFSRGDVGVTLRLRWRVEAHLVALQTRYVTILSDNKIIHRSSWVTNTFNGQMIHLKFTEPCKNLYPGSLVRQHLPGSMKHDQLLHWRIT